MGACGSRSPYATVRDGVTPIIDGVAAGVTAPVTTIGQALGFGAEDKALIRSLQQERARLVRELRCNPHWGNSIAEVVWPTVSVFALDKIIESLGPALAAIPQLSGLQFDRKSSHLGQKPVAFREIWIQPEANSENLVLKGRLQWEGDLSIRLLLNGIPFGISDLSVDGQLVVELVGMITDFPLFNGGRMYFVEPPAVNLDFSGFGAFVNALNALKRRVLGVINDKLAHAMVLPYCFGLKLNPKADIFSIVYPGLHGILWLHVWKAEGLPAMDWYLTQAASSDPYVEVRIGGKRFTSPTVVRSLSPTFSYTVPLPVASIEEQSVHITIWDQDYIHADDFLGKVSFNIKEAVDSWSAKERAFDLCDQDGQPGSNGKVWLRADWRPLCSDPSDLAGASTSYAVVFAGVRAARFVPRAGNERKSFWVQVQCTNLLDFGTEPTEPQETLAYLLPPDDRSDEQKGAQGKQLQEKIAVLRGYGVTDEHIASVLEVGSMELKELEAGAGTDCSMALAASMGSCDVEWEEGFQFPVKFPSDAKLTFALKTQSMDSPSDEPECAGMAEFLFKRPPVDYETEGATRKFEALLDLSDGCITGACLDVCLKVGWFGPSSINC